MLECRHELQSVGAVSVMACATCASVQFWDDRGPLDRAEGVAQVFGSFSMRTTLPALGAPGPEAMVYDPPNRAGRKVLEVFPAHVWLEAQPGLWMSTDGDHLVLSPSDPTVSHHLGRGA
ncbi:MAG: hypothetical protein HKN46_00170 [Acidimicrobiia bacterium]|nr:hypothetical protein [Acidimicrobiia bacterium]